MELLLVLSAKNTGSPEFIPDYFEAERPVVERGFDELTSEFFLQALKPTVNARQRLAKRIFFIFKNLISLNN